jgi:P-type Cu2+ transporter
MIADFRRRFWLSAALTIPVLALSPMFMGLLGLEGAIAFRGDSFVVFALASVIYVYGGWPFLAGLTREVAGKAPGMMTLIGMAVTVAYAYSTATVFGLAGKPFFWELATLIDIMLLGHWIEMKSVVGAGKALEELARLMPETAHRIGEDGQVEDVPAASLKAGQRILIKPGEKVPADGTIVKGRSALNEAMLTGESQPVAKGEGAAVIGGAINGEGALTVEVAKVGADSFLSSVIRLVEEAQASKSKTQDLANRAALWLTAIALGAGALTFFGWWLFTGEPLAFAVERTVTVMVITCPHALGLAVPLVVAVSTSLAAGNGLLIRNRAAFEGARNVGAVVFDKTGTLTLGAFGVSDVLALGGGFTRADILNYAAAIEAHSEHPIAKAIAAAVDKPLPVEAFKAIPGQGAEGRVNGKNVRVASPGFVREQGLLKETKDFDRLSGEGKTVVFVLIGERLAGAIALTDQVRPESKEAVARLKKLGIRTLMLTGDNREVAARVAKEIGLDEVIAEVLPAQKVEKIKEIQARGLKVAMTGDGINDAPALAQADVGIAIGAGTDVAIATADIVLVKSNPKDVAAIMTLARATYRKMVQNLAWATGYNALAIPAAAGALYAWDIMLTPAVGAVLMSLSTVICAVNARMLRL